MTAMTSVTKVVLGTKIALYTSTPFTSAAGVPVYPDKVVVAFTVEGGTPTVFTYTEPTGDPTGTIVKDTQHVGYYTATIDTTSYGAGLWQYSIVGEPTSYAQDSTATKVRFDGQLTVTTPPFSIS